MTTLTAAPATFDAIRDALRASLAAAGEPSGSHDESVSAVLGAYADGYITMRQRDVLLKLTLAALAEETFSRMVARCFAGSAPGGTR